MRASICVAALAVLAVSSCAAERAHEAQRSALSHRNRTAPAFDSWNGAVDSDPLAEVSAFLDAQERNPDAYSLMQLEASMGVGKVHGFCEICILIMQMKERGQPHLCAGLNPDYYVTVSWI